MNSDLTKGQKQGADLEEILRAYFLRAGFFVSRGVSFLLGDAELTDIDLWLYERPTGSSRRRLLVDIKSTTRPKAVERMIWARGLCEVLNFDGAYVATPDARTIVRQIANRFGVLILDGTDLDRIQKSSKIDLSNRITEDQLKNLITSVDKSRHGKEYMACWSDVKGCVVEHLGAKSAVRALDACSYFAQRAVESHPNSAAAITAGRLLYMSAALAAISLDYIGVNFSFRSVDERKAALLNAIRYGNSDGVPGIKELSVATQLLRDFAPSGAAIAKQVSDAIEIKLNAIPAEIIADQVLRFGTGDAIFKVGRELEASGYQEHVPAFDQLQPECQDFIAAILDFCRVDRVAFATAWNSAPPPIAVNIGLSDTQQSLFVSNDIAEVAVAVTKAKPEKPKKAKRKK